METEEQKKADEYFNNILKIANYSLDIEIKENELIKLSKICGKNVFEWGDNFFSDSDKRNILLDNFIKSMLIDYLDKYPIERKYLNFIKFKKMLKGYLIYRYRNIYIKDIINSCNNICCKNSNDKNIKIFYGKTCTGKTKKTHEIKSEYYPGEVLYLNVTAFPSDNQKSPWLFRQCTKETKLIIIDDCYKNFKYESHISSDDGSITVHKKNERPFVIYPQIIFITQHLPKVMSDSFLKKFDLVEFK